MAPSMVRSIVRLALAAAAFALGGPVAAAEDAFLYSTRSDNRVHLVRADDLESIASIDAGVGAHELAVSPDGRWAVGSAYGGPGQGHMPPDSRVVVIDLPARKVHQIVDLAMRRPNDIVFAPGGESALITVEDPPALVRLDVATGKFESMPLTHKAGHMMALSPDGSTAWIAHVMPGLVCSVDARTGEERFVVDIKPGAEGIAVTPDGARLWVACNRSDTIFVIDTATATVADMFDAEGFPFRVRCSPDSATVAVSLPGDASVALYAASDPTKVRRVSVAHDDPGVKVVPTSIAFSRDGSCLAVVCDGARPRLVRIDVGAGKVTHQIDTAAIPDALAAAPGG